MKRSESSTKLGSCSLSTSPEITVVIDSPGIDQLPVNQRVAGSSPADGAIFYACHKDVTVRVGGYLGNPLGNHSPSRFLIILSSTAAYPCDLPAPSGFERTTVLYALAGGINFPFFSFIFKTSL